MQPPQPEDDATSGTLSSSVVSTATTSQPLPHLSSTGNAAPDSTSPREPSLTTPTSPTTPTTPTSSTSLSKSTLLDEHWPHHDVVRLFDVVEEYLKAGQQVKMNKASWKKVAELVDTDYDYTWSECHAKYTAVSKQRKQDAKQQTIEAERLAIAKKNRRELLDRLEQARVQWQGSAEQRQSARCTIHNAVSHRFLSSTPEKVLSELEKRPKGTVSFMRKCVQETWLKDVWQSDVLRKFGRTWLHGYQVLPDVDIEFHHQAGNKFALLAKMVRRAMERWEFCKDTCGPTVAGEEGTALRNVARECLSLDYTENEADERRRRLEAGDVVKEEGVVVEEEEEEEEPISAGIGGDRDGPSPPKNTKKINFRRPRASHGWYKRAELELGVNHVCRVQLLLLSVSIRLKLLDREAELSSLRASGVSLDEMRSKKAHFQLSFVEEAEMESKKSDKNNESNESNESNKSNESNEMEERRKLKTTSVDAVRYSPSLARERSITSLVRDIDRADDMCRHLNLQVSSDSEDLHLVAKVKMVRALALAVGGTHWIVGEWARGYSTVSTVTDAIVANSTILALATAVPRVTARYARWRRRELWTIENNRLKQLEETVLRRERARLRQEYRRHKKRGRPGRIEMKQAKVELDTLQMDLDHCLGRCWHPKHDMKRPEIETPREWERKGLPRPIRERMPVGWVKVEVPYYDGTQPPYYVDVDTGMTHAKNPLAAKREEEEEEAVVEVEEKSNKEEDKDKDKDKEKNKEEDEEDEEEEAEDIVHIDPNHVVEQHRMYFKESLECVEESISILTTLGSPLLYEAIAAKARISFAAGGVAESDGNQATGLAFDASLLNNMACDNTMLAMEEARSAGLRYTMEYAALCRRAARHSTYRRHDGDVSDAAERIKESLDIYKCLELEKTKGATWQIRQAGLELESLGEFSGYDGGENEDGLGEGGGEGEGAEERMQVDATETEFRLPSIR